MSSYTFDVHEKISQKQSILSQRRSIDQLVRLQSYESDIVTDAYTREFDIQKSLFFN